VNQRESESNESNALIIRVIRGQTNSTLPFRCFKTALHDKIDGSHEVACPGSYYVPFYHVVVRRHAGRVRSGR
jgi:hypothetical protein